MKLKPRVAPQWMITSFPYWKINYMLLPTARTQPSTHDIVCTYPRTLATLVATASFTAERFCPDAARFGRTIRLSTQAICARVRLARPQPQCRRHSVVASSAPDHDHVHDTARASSGRYMVIYPAAAAAATCGARTDINACGVYGAECMRVQAADVLSAHPRFI